MRIENSIKNITISLAGRVIDLLLAFITRAVFLKFLSLEYLGISGLFTNILSILNLAELGIGSAIIYALYEPLANGDQEKIKGLMQIYKKAYFIIGLVVFTIGLSLMPFLEYFIKSNTNLVNIRFVFFLYVIQSVSSYWFFAYKSALLDADQKKYISSIILYLISVVGKIVQIISLFLLSKNPMISYYIYTILGILFNIVHNCIVSRVVNEKYPYITDKNYIKISDSERKNLVKNIYGLTLYKISTIANGAADTIIISAFIGLSLVGLYSNYITIVTAVSSVLRMIFTPIISSIGNLYVKESKEKTEVFFNILHFVSAWMYGFCSICLFILSNQFIEFVWLGPGYILSVTTLLMISIDFLVDGLMNAPIVYRSACGLFWENRYRAIIATTINLVLSIIFTTKFNFGISGIILATIISRLGITLWFDPYIIFRKVFEKSPIAFYFRYFYDLIIIIITGILTFFVVIATPFQGIPKFIFSLCACTVVPNVIWWCMFHKKQEYRYIKSIIIKTINNKLQLRRNI